MGKQSMTAEGRKQDKQPIQFKIFEGVIVVTGAMKSPGFVSKIMPERKDAPMILGYLVVIFFLWQYLTKFFSLSKEIIDEIAVSVMVNDIQLNQSFYSLSNSLMVIGPIFLLLFTRVSLNGNEK